MSKRLSWGVVVAVVVVWTAVVFWLSSIDAHGQGPSRFFRKHESEIDGRGIRRGSDPQGKGLGDILRARTTSQHGQD